MCWMCLIYKLCDWHTTPILPKIHVLLTWWPKDVRMDRTHQQSYNDPYARPWIWWRFWSSTQAASLLCTCRVQGAWHWPPLAPHARRTACRQWWDVGRAKRRAIPESVVKPQWTNGDTTCLLKDVMNELIHWKNLRCSCGVEGSSPILKDQFGPTLEISSCFSKNGTKKSKGLEGPNPTNPNPNHRPASKSPSWIPALDRPGANAHRQAPRSEHEIHQGDTHHDLVVGPGVKVQ